MLAMFSQYTTVLISTFLSDLPGCLVTGVESLNCPGPMAGDEAVMWV